MKTHTDSICVLTEVSRISSFSDIKSDTRCLRLRGWNDLFAHCRQQRLLQSMSRNGGKAGCVGKLSCSAVSRSAQGRKETQWEMQRSPRGSQQHIWGQTSFCLWGTHRSFCSRQLPFCGWGWAGCKKTRGSQILSAWEINCLM